MSARLGVKDIRFPGHAPCERRAQAGVARRNSTQWYIPKEVNEVMMRGFAKFKIQRTLAAAALLAWGGLAAAAQEQGDVSPKGIFLSDGEDRRTGVRFSVLLKRDGKSRIVSSNHRFRDADRMKFQFTLNRDSYVYVVHRTLEGDPSSDRVRRYAGPKGIEVVRDDNRDRGGSGNRDRDGTNYQLLFPNEKVGRKNRLKARRLYTVPADRNKYFTMDDNPGIEKLYVVVSPQRLDIEDHFDIRDGGVRRGRSGGDGRRDDSSSDVLDRLTAQLAEYAGNADLSLSKGIEVEEVDSYGIGVERGRPLMIEVDLAHHRN